jgi:SNF2 family DNA or RNA helicase
VNDARTLSGKLLQLANGTIYDNENQAVEIHHAKLDAMMDVLEAANGKPVLLFYLFRHDLARILEATKQYHPVHLTEHEHIGQWNAGAIELLIAHPASCGHGLNLQDGGSTIVWYGMTWSLELYLQANARLYRQGQRNTVVIHHLVAQDTMDELVLKVLSSKNATQQRLIDAVHAHLVKVKARH